MGKLVVFMTMSVDGFVAGPNNELDWMLPTCDQELHRDRIAALKRFNVVYWPKNSSATEKSSVFVAQVMAFPTLFGGSG